MVAIPAGLIAAGLFAGCDRMRSQAEAEARFANDIARSLREYASITNASVTNLAQLFPLMKYGYPFFHHAELSRFGERAGFSNSLAEKYVFFSSPFSNRYVQGEIICIGAKPFRWGNEGLRRFYIARLGVNYIFRDLPEDRVEMIVGEANPAFFHLGDVQPPPPRPREVQEWYNPSLADRYERLVWDLSGTLDQDSSTLVRIALPIVGGVFLTLTFVAVGFLLRRRPPPTMKSSEQRF